MLIFRPDLDRLECGWCTLEVVEQGSVVALQAARRPRLWRFAVPMIGGALGGAGMAGALAWMLVGLQSPFPSPQVEIVIGSAIAGAVGVTVAFIVYMRTTQAKLHARGPLLSWDAASDTLRTAIDDDQIPLGSEARLEARKGGEPLNKHPTQIESTYSIALTIGTEPPRVLLKSLIERRPLERFAKLVRDRREACLAMASSAGPA